MADKEKREGPPAGGTRKRQRETAADRARLGSVIASSYRIDEFLGRGAIGAVFGGMHLRLERRVAVKFVDPSLVDDPEIRARFKREAKICAQIGSSHAVEVFDYGVGEDGAPYLVMERLDGEDLHARLVRDGPLTVDRALRIAKQVCRALGAAHQNGIVHRDLKPENVYLVERDGEREFVKVVDFGLSTFVQSDDTRLTRAGQSVGTPLYMAPEQAGAHAFDARVDVYSLGVLIFEMTTGRLPFEASTLQALLVALATQPPRSFRQYNPRLPIELDDLVLRFIARDPRVRPKTAAAALAEIVALEERMADKAANAPKRIPTPAPPRPSPSGKRRELAIDGLPGKLSSEFAEELNSHLSELRRTGRLATSDVNSEDAPLTQREPEPSTEPSTDPINTPQPASSPPNSERIDATRPMQRAEIDDLMSEPKVPVATKRTSNRPPSPAAATDSQKMRRLHASDDVVEEDSGLFYGRVSKEGGQKGSPGPIVIHEVPRANPPSRRTDPPPKPPDAKGPPVLILFVAIVAFLVVAALVAVKMMRG
jgi:serine/threonine-protein kinase